MSKANQDQAGMLALAAISIDSYEFTENQLPDIMKYIIQQVKDKKNILIFFFNRRHQKFSRVCVTPPTKI